MNFYQVAYDCLMQSDIDEKLKEVERLYQDHQDHHVAQHSQSCNDLKSEQITLDGNPARIETPGRPDKPELIPVTRLKQRKLGSELGRATLIHAICHIEFNAINLALDAVYRFRGMPADYTTDWLKIASEEAYHFTLLRARLQEMGYDYGDMPAHNGLWEMVLKTDHDVMIRMALVPRVLEARGLDVTPAMMDRLAAVGDTQTVDILKIILHDEIGHVAIGSRWFKYCCEKQKLNPEQTFRDLLVEYMGGSLRGPFNNDARLQAGFTQEEMDELVKLGSF